MSENLSKNEEIGIEILEKFLLDSEGQIAFETCNNSEVEIKCIVEYDPLKNDAEPMLHFKNEAITIIKIPYKSIAKILVEKHFDGLWKTIMIHCNDETIYYLNF